MALNTLNICKCQNIKAIPLAFDESLSYLEELSAILNKLNETIVQVNKNTYWIDNYEDQYEELQQEIDNINAELDVINNSLENKVDLETLNASILALKVELEGVISNNYTVLKNYVDAADENLQYQIDNFAADNIKVYDPTTGLLSPLQTVLNNIYDETRDEAITCTEFDSLEDLTATWYDNKEITAFNFDRYSKTLLTEE